MSSPRIGAYVLATKFHDGDPGDPWALGFYAGRQFGDRYMVLDSAGKIIRAGGYRRIGEVTVDFGNWLWKVRDALEASPPGTVNLWTMMGPRATPEVSG